MPEREGRLMRAARSRGYRLLRFHRRDAKGKPHRGYLVVDYEANAVVLGAVPTSLDDVEDFLMDGTEPRQRRRVGS